MKEPGANYERRVQVHAMMNTNKNTMRSKRERKGGGEGENKSREQSRKKRVNIEGVLDCES